MSSESLALAPAFANTAESMTMDLSKNLCLGNGCEGIMGSVAGVHDAWCSGQLTTSTVVYLWCG